MSFWQPIIDFLRESWELALPFVVIRQYSGGVILRFGKFRKTIGPGLHWKIPFADSVDSCNVVMTTMSPGAQSVTTIDGKDVVIQCIIKYRVTDVKIFLMEVEEARDALADITQGVIRKVVAEKTWVECCAISVDKEITEQVRIEARKWGLRVIFVTLKTLGIMKSFRLILDPIGQISERVGE